LAGKTGKQYIKIRNGNEVNFLNISFGFFTEVSFVGYTGIGCPKTPFLGHILCPVFGPGHIASKCLE
jgi:hypothetical protein